jgi:hypothetical protein
MAALLVAGPLAWADGIPEERGTVAAPKAGDGTAVPAAPVTTMTPEQGGYMRGKELGVVSNDSLLEAIRPDGYRSQPKTWQGQVRLRWRYRNTTEAGQVDDNDLYGYLKLKWRDENLPGWSGSFHGRATLDVGPFGDTSEYYAFDSITDTWSDRLNGRIYHAYVNYRRPDWFVEQIRVGRMYSDVGEYISFDGVQLKTRPLGRGKWQVLAFGGVPAYIFEDDPAGDWTVGAGVRGLLGKSADLRLDYTYLEDTQKEFGTLRDHLVNITVNKRFGLNTILRGQFQQRNENPRLVRLNFDSVIPRHDLTVRALFHTLITAQNEAVYDWDYFYAVALELEPYYMGNLSVAKGIGEFFEIEAGVSGRQLYDNANEGRYNRNFGQYFLTVASYDWLLRDLNMSISGEYWSSTDDIWTVTFDLDWRVTDAWRLRLGTDYAAYRFDMYADDERQNVFGGFFRVTWRPSDRWRLDFRVRVDDDDFGTWTRLDMGAAFDF